MAETLSSRLLKVAELAVELSVALVQEYGRLHSILGEIRMTQEDLSAAQSRSEASTATVLGHIRREIQQVADLVAAGQTDNSAIVSRINAVSDMIDQASADLAANDPASPNV